MIPPFVLKTEFLARKFCSSHDTRARVPDVDWSSNVISPGNLRKRVLHQLLNFVQSPRRLSTQCIRRPRDLLMPTLPYDCCLVLERLHRTSAGDKKITSHCQTDSVMCGASGSELLDKRSINIPVDRTFSSLLDPPNGRRRLALYRFIDQIGVEMFFATNLDAIIICTTNTFHCHSGTYWGFSDLHRSNY